MATAWQIKQMLRRSGADEIPDVIGKTHNRIHVADVHPLRIRPERIERDAERRVQAAGENLHLLWLAVRGDAAENFDPARAGFREKDVSVGSDTHQAGIGQAGGEDLDLEALGHAELGIRWAGDDFGDHWSRSLRQTVGGRSASVMWRKVPGFS